MGALTVVRAICGVFRLVAVRRRRACRLPRRAIRRTEALQVHRLPFRPNLAFPRARDLPDQVPAISSDVSGEGTGRGEVLGLARGAALLGPLIRSSRGVGPRWLWRRARMAESIACRG